MTSQINAFWFAHAHQQKTDRIHGTLNWFKAEDLAGRLERLVEAARQAWGKRSPGRRGSLPGYGGSQKRSTGARLLNAFSCSMSTVG
jgi:hypothetical protein